MIDNSQLLKHARNAAASIGVETDKTEQKSILGSSDVILNELMLREDPTFYLDYIERGKVLLLDGQELAGKLNHTLPDAIGLRDDLTSEMRTTILNAEIDKIYCNLLGVIGALDEGGSAAEKAWLIAVSDWESSLYQHRLNRIEVGSKATEKPITETAMLTYLQQKFPQWKNLRLVTFVPLAGGFSKKTILVDTQDDLNGKQSIVFRLDQGINLFQFDGTDIAKEFHIIQLVRRCGVPVAEPLWLEADASRLGFRFMVSRRAVGKTYGNHFGSDQGFSQDSIGAVVDSLVSTLVKLHQVPIDPHDADVQASHLKDWLPYKTVTEATRYCVSEYLPRLIRLTDVPMTPQLQRALNWLARNVPEVDEPAVITHLDYGFNNIMFDGTQISAVLDWETSHPGDPAADIAWTHHQNLAPYMSMDELLRRYKAGTGRDISQFRLAYWRVVNCMGGAMACLSSLRALETQEAPPINIAVMAFQYVAYFGPQFNALIEAAEKVRDL